MKRKFNLKSEEIVDQFMGMEYKRKLLKISNRPKMANNEVLKHLRI